MLMKKHKVVKTCPKGTKYTLVFDGVFRWTREGNLPIKLEGAFSSQIEAYLRENQSPKIFPLAEQ